MTEQPFYNVTIRIERGVNWERHFAGRPTQTEVLAALHLDRDRLLENDEGLHADRYSAGFTNFVTLLNTYGMPAEGREHNLCVFAGVMVGEITVKEEKKTILMTEATQ